MHFISSLLSTLLSTVEQFPLITYWIILLVALCESLMVIGLLVPGTFFLVAVGYLSATGALNIGNAILFATIGAVVGDGISFYLGGKSSGVFGKKNKFFKSEYLEKGDVFFKQHGGKSIFLGRFIGSIRPIIPFIAGASKMNKKAFFTFNMISALVWSLSYLLLGYFMAQAWQTSVDFSMIEAWSSTIGLVLLAASSFFLLIFLLRQVIYNYGKRIFGIIASMIK
jgi:membrane protein DedA with SNARE-associated domain